jgi:hypothetical protein
VRRRSNPCPKRDRLKEEVLGRLFRIAELSQATAEAVEDGAETLVATLDKQTEAEFGKKERVLGALRQHRLEHGC